MGSAGDSPCSPVLGLLACGSAWEALNGSLEFVPTGLGTHLHIVLPIEAVKARTADVRRAGRPRMTSVLIVDDHPIVLQGCRRVFTDMGITTIHEANTVVGGYRALLRHHPDLVITDLSLSRRRSRRG